MILRSPCLSLGLAALALGACRAPDAEREEKVYSSVRHGHYAQALDEAKQNAEQHPGDAQAQELLRDAQVAFILDQGREEVFRGDLNKALALFEQAALIAPGHPTVESWIGKTKGQLAVQWLDHAADLTSPEQLDEAEAAYEKVLEYMPENLEAKRGLAHALLLKNYRAGQSKTYFDDGLSSFRELLLQEARRAFQVSVRYRENEPASTRGDQVEKMMAEERLAQAQGFENEGLFFAARNEYRLVLLIDPENGEGRAGLDRMDREARAKRTIASADMKVRRGEYEDAAQELEQVKVLTKAQEDDVTLLASGIEERKNEEMYQDARRLADDYRYPEAVEAYDKLLALAPEYKDAARRKATLLEFIRTAEDFYAKADAAANDVDAEQYLRAIQVIWPEYRDIGERLKAIEARKAEAKPGTPAPQAQPKKPGAR